MKLSEFDYILPPEQIAQTPIEPRDASKLLALDKGDGTISDHVFSDIADMLCPSDVLVINSTRVIKARLKWKLWEKDIEIFLHKQISKNTWDCLVYPWKKLKPGAKVDFYHQNSRKSQVLLTAHIQEISENGRIVEFETYGNDFFEVLEILGEIPLPPYIKEKSNDERYQTVYNDEIGGSVAAPTAGLHFTTELLETLKKRWVKIEKVLLHVGLGTFMNVDTEDIEDHHMHSEYISLSQQTAQRLNTYKSEWKTIIAVGTTSIRVLESFSNSNGILSHGSKDTDIFIYPGYEWRFVESLITNFHLPKSTLLMLVSSLAGKEHIEKAYRHAIDSDYRFFSFGDAMWIK